MRSIIEYLTHLPDCNLEKDWSEAYDAFANTPDQFRDHEYNEAVSELHTKAATCTCGLQHVLAVLKHNPNLLAKINDKINME